MFQPTGSSTADNVKPFDEYFHFAIYTSYMFLERASRSLVFGKRKKTVTGVDTRCPATIHSFLLLLLCVRVILLDKTAT